MKKIKLFPAALLGFVVLCARCSRCFQTSPTEAPDENRITLEVNRVNLLFTVSDKKGRFVTDLGRDDFEISENKKPQKVLEFTAETNLPLRLAILVDTSNSIRDRFRFQQEAAIRFIDSVLRRGQDKAIVVSFDTAAELVADMTDDTEILDKAVQGMRPGGGTSLYDAVFFACRDKLMQDQPLHKFRRAMVILSDGEDNQSRYTMGQALEMAQKADVVIYTISTNITHEPTDGDKVMKLFRQRNRRPDLLPVPRHRSRSASFENIANELRYQYSILYQVLSRWEDRQVCITWSTSKCRAARISSCGRAKDTTLRAGK